MLVFDLGMNNGDDAENYLRRGLRVVSLEANPMLCKQAGERFKQEIHQGNLIIINAALSESSGFASFFVSTSNDHWSSLSQRWAARDGGEVVTVKVKTLTLADLIAQFGVPDFLKSDIEGADSTVLIQLQAGGWKPKYVSVEDCAAGFAYLAILHDCGYTQFKLLDQSTVPAGTSGPLGDELVGEWLSYENMLDYYSVTVRTKEGVRIASRDHWWDIHAKL